MDDRAVAEERRARFLRARREGGLCGACGRVLARDEPVWRARFGVGPGYVMANSVWVVPVGVECVPPEALQATEGQASERCAACDRAVYHVPSKRRRTRAFCSERCRVQDEKAVAAQRSRAHG